MSKPYDVEVVLRWRREEFIKPLQDGEYVVRVWFIEPWCRDVKVPPEYSWSGREVWEREYGWKLLMEVRGSGKKFWDFLLLSTPDKRRGWMVGKTIKFLELVGVGEEALERKERLKLKPEDFCADCGGRFAKWLRVRVKTSMRQWTGKSYLPPAEYVTRVVEYLGLADEDEEPFETEVNEPEVDGGENGAEEVW